MCLSLCLCGSLRIHPEGSQQQKQHRMAFFSYSRYILIPCRCTACFNFYAFQLYAMFRSYLHVLRVKHPIAHFCAFLSFVSDAKNIIEFRNSKYLYNIQNCVSLLISIFVLSLGLSFVSRSRKSNNRTVNL